VQHPRRLVGRRFGVGLVVVLVSTVLVGAAVWRGLAIQRSAEDAREHLVAARAAMSEAVNASSAETTTSTEAAAPPAMSARLLSACGEAAAAADSLKDVNSQLQTIMPLVGMLEGVPGVGARARSQAVTLEAGTQIAEVGTSLCDGLGPIAELLAGEADQAGTQTTSEVVQAVVRARPKMVAATQKLEQLQASLQNIHDEDLEGSHREAVAALRARLPTAVKTMHDASILLDLLGSDRPRRFLLVSQNPDELRATGGYIGSAGIVEANGGAIRLVEYGTSRRYDTPPQFRAVPPEPFQRYLGANVWHFAAANWWVSFPDSARQLAYFYGLSNPQEPIDGVIALDQFGMSRLLEVLGPVDVPEFGERVGAADVEPKLNQYVHVRAEETQRKQFTAALSEAVLKSVLTAPRSQLPDLVRAVKATLDQQHMLVWVTEPNAAQLFADRRWDGSILPASGDTLMIVDTDVGGSKKSQAVTRDAAYAVTLASGEPARASLQITYANNAWTDEMPDNPPVHRYRTFLRVYVPGGATLTSASGFDGDIAVGQECGRRTFGGMVTVLDRDTTDVKLEYQLPDVISNNRGYDLLVQQQPGVPPGRVGVNINAAGFGAGTVRTELLNEPGRNAHWRVNFDDSPALVSAPLPRPALGGCGADIVQATTPSPPASVTIGSVGIDASVVELGVHADGEMEAPQTGDVIGWYRTSARPGQPGNSVMSGHVDWGKKAAVFWGLRNLKQGDRIQVRDAAGDVHTYAVEWNQSYPWSSAPVDRIVGATVTSALTLITCDGSFDARLNQYAERRVVRAQLVD
jgi:sortase (surface protein transpeptidase)